jgi:hypothetical protein
MSNYRTYITHVTFVFCLFIQCICVFVHFYKGILTQ